MSDDERDPGQVMGEILSGQHDDSLAAARARAAERQDEVEDALEFLGHAPGERELIAAAITSALFSTDETDDEGRPANVVDALYAVAEAIGHVALMLREKL